MPKLRNIIREYETTEGRIEREADCVAITVHGVVEDFSLEEFAEIVATMTPKGSTKDTNNLAHSLIDGTLDTEYIRSLIDAPCGATAICLLNYIKKAINR